MAGKTHAFNVPLGYLRGFLVLLVVAHHSALAYAQILPAPPTSFTANMAWNAFPVFDAHRTPVLALFAGINDIFFMSLLFFLSGLFVAQSIERKGKFTFIRDRIIRLGIPFAIAAAVLGPLAYFPAFAQITGTMNVHEFWRQWMTLAFWPAGPAWFIWLLLAFDFVAFLLFLILPGWASAIGRLGSWADKRPLLFFLLLIALSALAYAPMAMKFGSSTWSPWGPFDFQTARLFHYALYFLIGVGLGAYGTERGLIDPEGGLARGWWLWIIFAVIGYVLVNAIVIAAIAAKGQPQALWEGVGGIGFAIACAALSFAFLALFLKFVKRPAGIWDSLRDNSYGIYLFHYALVNWLQFTLLKYDLSAFAKFGIVFAGAAISAWIITAILRSIPGVRRVI